MFGIFKRLFGEEKPEKCDHIYFPVFGGEGKVIGQACALCQKFNSLAQVEAACARRQNL